MMSAKQTAKKLIRFGCEKQAAQHVQNIINDLNAAYSNGLPEGIKQVEAHWKRVMLEIELYE